MVMLLLLVYASLYLYNMLMKADFTDMGNIFESLNLIPAALLLIQYLFVAIRTTILVDKRNIRIVRSLADLDYKLNVDLDQEFYKKSCTMSKRLLSICIFVIVVGMSNKIGSEDIGELVIVSPAYIQHCLGIGMFCALIKMLVDRLHLINSYLTKFISEKDCRKLSVFNVTERKGGTQKCYFIGCSSSKNMKIRDLAVAYDIIGKICVLINQVFNFQIIITLIATFDHMVNIILLSLHYYKTDVGHVSTYTVILWCTLDLSGVVFISLYCENLLLVRTDTKILVNEIVMDYELPKCMRIQAKAFMELIEARPLQICIYHMFYVDITFVLKYLSLATTYLIIATQIAHYL